MNHGKTTSVIRNSGQKSTLTERDHRTLGRIVSKNHTTTAAQVFPLCILMGSVGTSCGIINATALYLSVCEWGFNIFCIVFCVQKAIFICTSLKNFVIA
jgi:hypothetical protein